MTAQVSYERVRERLEQLKLKAALLNPDDILEKGQKKDRLTIEILDELLECEIADRFERKLRTNHRVSGIPANKRLEDFDYAAQPQVPEKIIRELATLRFVANGENVIFLGPPGVGKTHLTIGLALKVLETGKRVYFQTLHDMITKARELQQRNRLANFQGLLLRPDVLVLDELGFLPLTATDATFFFEVVNKRYQAGKSIIITSNKGFSDWGQIFADETLAVAILDRLLHHATTINIRGESYRLKSRREAGLIKT